MTLLNILIIPVFLICLYSSLKFIWGNEGKDERGKTISTTSYLYSFPIFPIGWLLIEFYHKYINAFDFDLYRSLIGILIPLTFIVQGIIIATLKRKI
ncbi:MULTISPECIES: hypothetical protein [unclassified Exiguobacterium]|uniref:hypothetical protein n=1 Tax=unclassified Exiguobacterium TaxID=2644629 RepID=UPI001BE9D5C3|nr:MULTISPECIES: hypothetical protein [unclassified Exiguobacterium]